MAQSFTRREFYDLVWSKPIIRLAEEFGLSDVALHKICRKHHIPNPPAGWWAKKAAGKKVQQLPLPDVETGRSDIITIRSAPTADWKTRAIEAAHTRTQSAPSQIQASPKRGGRIVRNTLAALRRGTANEQGLVCIREAGLIPCSVSKKSIGRVAVFLPKLESVAAIQSFQLTEDGEPSRFSNGTQAVKFEITESYAREKHQPTKKETAEVTAWQKRTARRSWRHDPNDNYPIYPDWDYSPTGRLSISLEPVWHFRYPTPRRSFNDGKQQRLENLLDKIAVGIVVMAAAKAERQREDQERARRWEEEKQRRETEARRKYVEGRRQAELAGLLEALQRTDRFERLLSCAGSAIEKGNDDRISMFRDWLQSQIDEDRHLLSPEGLRVRFEEMNLFGPNDGRDFRG